MSETELVRPKWSKWKKATVAVVVVALFIALPIFAHLFWEIHKARQVFAAFNQALIARDYQKAYNLTAPALMSNVSYEAFVGVENGLAARVGGLQRTDISESSVRDDKNGDFATIRTRLIFERRQLPFVYVLKKENGRWLIYSFNEQ